MTGSCFLGRSRSLYQCVGHSATDVIISECLRCDGGRSEDLCVAAAATPPPPAGCSGHQDSGGGPRPARLEPPPLPAGSPSPRPAPDRHPLHPQSLPEANTLLDRSPLPSQGSLSLRSGRGCEPLKGSALRLHSCCNL